MQVQIDGVLEELLLSRVMSLVRRLFGCLGRRDDPHHHSHSSSFDSAKQQHVVDAGAAAANVAKRKSSNGKAPLRVRFNVPASEAFKSSSLHAPLKDLLVYIIREGLRVNDLFRRPGNSADMKCIMKQLADGRPVNWTDYNFYTVANTAKKFLLNITGGIFGTECEKSIMDTFDCDEASRIRIIGGHLQAMPTGARQFLVLLFGAWYLTVYGSGPSTSVSNANVGGNQLAINSTTETSNAPSRASLSIQLEAVSKSVCGSLFHTCDDPRKVDRAVEIVKTMISQFVNPIQHGSDMLDYFVRATGIEVRRPNGGNGSGNGNSNDSASAVAQPSASNVDVSGRGCSSVSRNASHASRVSRHSSKRAEAAARIAATVDIAPVAAEYLQAVSTPDFLIVQVNVNVDVSSSQTTSAHHPGLLQIATNASCGGNGNGTGRNFPRSLAITGNESGCDSHLLHIRTPVSRFNSVRRRQLDRLKKRSEWFREVPHAPNISLSALFQERWRAAIEELETKQRDVERSAGIADLQTAHSGPEIDIASSSYSHSHSPFQFVANLLRSDENDSLGTPASEPLRRAWLGARRDDFAPAGPLTPGDTITSTAPTMRTDEAPSTSRSSNGNGNGSTVAHRRDERGAAEQSSTAAAANSSSTSTTTSATAGRYDISESRSARKKKPDASKRPFVVAEDEPSSSVTVERFEFEPSVSDDDEHWSANTVL